MSRLVWRLAVFGLLLVATSPVLAAPDDVSVTQVKGGKVTSCPGLDDASSPCRKFITSEGKMRFKVRTLAGDMNFARCLYNFNLQIDGRGRTKVDTMITGGKSPCNDIRPCRDKKRTRWLTWSGQIERTSDGRLIHRADACIDTCLGQFKGTLVMRLSRRGERWRATVDEAPVGMSGLVIEGGEWDLDIPGLRLG